MNLLQLAQQATGEMGIPIPNAVAGSSSADVQQVLALANAVGMKLQRDFEWEQLTKEYRFTTQYQTVTGSTVQGSNVLTLTSPITVDTTYAITGNGLLTDTNVAAAVTSSTNVTMTNIATSTQSLQTYTLAQVKYAVPSDYDRMIDRTQWDKSRRWMLVGPQTAQQWQWLKSGWISTGPRVRFRVLGGYFQVYPPIASNSVYGYEYYSTSWVKSLSGSAQTLFLADTDTCIYPDRLMIAGIKAEYFGIKGFDATKFEQEYEIELMRAKSMDSPQDTLSMCPNPGQVILGANNIPDTGYGGVL